MTSRVELDNGDVVTVKATGGNLTIRKTTPSTGDRLPIMLFINLRTNNDKGKIIEALDKALDAIEDSIGETEGD